MKYQLINIVFLSLLLVVFSLLLPKNVLAQACGTNSYLAVTECEPRSNCGFCANRGTYTQTVNCTIGSDGICGSTTYNGIGCNGNTPQIYDVLPGNINVCTCGVPRDGHVQCSIIATPTPTPSTPLCDGWASPNSCQQNTGNGCYYRCNGSGTGWNGPFGSGCSGSCGGGGGPPPSPPPPSQPTCSGINIPACVNKDGTFTVEAYNVANATKVEFPTWNPANGQDDISWYDATNVGGGTWRAIIPESAHRSAGSNTLAIGAYSSNQPSFPPSGASYCGGSTVAIPCDWIIQGLKMQWNGSGWVETALSTGQTTTLDGNYPHSGCTQNSPSCNYNYGPMQDTGNHTVSITQPPGCTVGYSLCNDDTTCHGTVTAASCSGGVCSATVNGATVKSNFNTVSDPFAYADLWWHFTCSAPTCSSITSNVSSTTALSGNQTFTINGVTGGANTVKLRISGPGGVLGTINANTTGTPGQYSAVMPLNSTTYYADPLTMRALITTASVTDYDGGCSMTFGRKVDLNGLIYNTNGATTGVVGGICSANTPPVPTTLSPAGGATCTYPGGGTCVVTGSGIAVRGASLSAGSPVLHLGVDAAAYTIACPASGNQSTSPTTYASTYNFYLTPNAGEWYQVVGGNIRSQSTSLTAVNSIVPSSCFSASCKLFRMASAAPGGTASSGYAVVGASGAVVTAAAPSTLSKLSEENNNVFAQSSNNAAIQDYDYFYELFDLPTAPTAPISTDTLTLASLSTSNATYVASHAYYVVPTAGPTGTVTISSSLAVPSGRSIVVFVNGNLSISGNSTSVSVPAAPGSFLMFIVKGNITFENSLGTTTMSSEVPTVQGVYLANGTVTTATTNSTATERKFIGAGTFVGWTGISLLRDIGVNNNSYAAELFLARPDFPLNAPAEIKRALYDWQEVAP